MNPHDLTDPIIRRMTPAARKQLGLQTAEEAMAKFTARSERELQNQIANFLRIRGIWFCHSRMDKPTTQRKGVPDFILALNGRATAFEVKFGKGSLSFEQIKTHDDMRKNGWDVYTIHVLSEVRELLASAHLEGEEG